MEAALTSIVGQRGDFECLGKLAANLIAFTEMDNTPKLETAGLQR
jgi:hypothetical protein